MPESDLLPLLLALRQPRAIPAGANTFAGPLQNQVAASQGIPGPAQTDAGGMNLLPQEQRVPPSQWTSHPVFQLLSALRAAPAVNRLLAQVGAQQAAPVTRVMPGPGYIPGDLHLNENIAPHVPNGQARPFAPGEWVQNPNGSWSSEETMTVSGNPQFNGGKPTVLPSLWIKDGKAYVAHNEDEAAALARASGLQFPSFPDMAAAEKFANEREAAWQNIKPADAGKIAPLWNPDTQYVEPPPAKQTAP